MGKNPGDSLYIPEVSDYFYLFLEDSLRVFIYMDMSNCFIYYTWTVTCQLQWIITYWIIITTVVIELLYVNKFC